MSHAAAVATGQRIGFVFTEADPYFFLDLDGCMTPDGWSAQSVALTHRFAGAMVETSQSGQGLHVFGTYSGPRPEHGTRCKEIHGELYTAGRFVAMGSRAVGDPNLDCTDALHALVVQHFPVVDRGGPGAASWGDGPRSDWTGTTDDDELIRKASASAGMAAKFGAQATFEQLWNNDEEALARAFPDSDPYNRSDADASLARHLAFWTGCDGDRIKRLMIRSELNREKWSREKYLDDTIAFGISHTKNVYDHVKPAPAPAGGGDFQFATIERQAEMFAGCIYVTSRNRVMLPDGQMLNTAQFNAVMPCYEFARDGTGQGTTRKPWEALTESLAFQCPVAQQACFDPTSPWDKPIERAGVTYANTYRPVVTPRKSGDPGRFLTHVEKLLPDAGDRAILLAYMAAVVQHKGVKFQWCPLIQGVEGNGKTMLTQVLMHAIGEKHAHTPQSHDLGSKFNAWLMGKILIGIEDIYVPGDRQEVIEALKPMITNGHGIGIRAMNTDEEMSRICANFIINSNHRDAIRKTRGDRRFAVFFTAQQEFDDLEHSGMGGSYFPDLYDWLRADGYAIVHDYLARYSIPDELNPANGHRAPITSTTDEAVAEGLGPVAQEIHDYVGEGRAGFRGGWISRSELSRQLKLEHRKVSIKVQQRILSEQGYMKHPALPDGRSNNIVEPDGRRAELWVLKSHPAASFDTASAASSNYESAQATSLETFNAAIQK
jgi:hypothetical protein